MLYHKYKPLASRVYCTGLALLLVLSEVFSSNVQDTLPGFSRIMRLGLTGCAVLLLAGKIILLTGYEARWQKVLIAVVLVYTAFSSWYGGDLWFFLAALIGLGAKDVDWETALRVYLVTAAAGLVLVQALHFATPLMPYKFYCRNWDFGVADRTERLFYSNESGTAGTATLILLLSLKGLSPLGDGFRKVLLQSANRTL